MFILLEGTWWSDYIQKCSGALCVGDGDLVQGPRDQVVLKMSLELAMCKASVFTFCTISDPNAYTL